jgi:hypothetical protein
MTVRDRESIDAELRLLAAVRLTIRAQSASGGVGGLAVWLVAIQIRIGGIPDAPGLFSECHRTPEQCPVVRRPEPPGGSRHHICWQVPETAV